MSTENPMTTTAPSTVAPRLTDEDTLGKAAAKAVDLHIRLTRERYEDTSAAWQTCCEDAARAAIAAAEPILRARHRAELWAELIAMYEGDAEGFGERASGMSVRLPALISGLKRLADQDAKGAADATRPVEGRVE